MIPGANEKNFEPVLSGVYTVSANLLDCPSTPSDGVLLNITGIENESHEGPIQFYPNPTNDHLFVKMSEGSDAIKSISMFDTMGKIVFEHEGNIDEGWAYDMSKHSEGVYIIRVRFKEGLAYTKIVKN